MAKSHVPTATAEATSASMCTFNADEAQARTPRVHEPRSERRRREAARGYCPLHPHRHGWRPDLGCSRWTCPRTSMGREASFIHHLRRLKNSAFNFRWRPPAIRSMDREATKLARRIDRMQKKCIGRWAKVTARIRGLYRPLLSRTFPLKAMSKPR